MRRALKPHVVRTAAAASEAEVELLDRHYTPDLVLCDIFLPGRTGDAREPERAVIRHRDSAGFFTEPHECPVAQCEPRPVECIEGLEDQQRHRLTHIERRPADRTEQIARIEFGNAGADPDGPGARGDRQYRRSSPLGRRGAWHGRSR